MANQAVNNPSPLNEPARRGDGRPAGPAPWLWTGPRRLAARLIAWGYTIEDAAYHSEVSERTINYWLNRPEFVEAVEKEAEKFEGFNYGPPASAGPDERAAWCEAENLKVREILAKINSKQAKKA
jgi:hypothetical protein